MPNDFDVQCQELRARIARSRRRLDRHVHGFAQASPVSLASGSRTWIWWAGALAVGLALSRWHDPPRFVESWRRQLLGTGLAHGLQQLARRVRVMAWQSRRARRAAAEETHDG